MIPFASKRSLVSRLFNHESFAKVGGKWHVSVELDDAELKKKTVGVATNDWTGEAITRSRRHDYCIVPTKLPPCRKAETVMEGDVLNVMVNETGGAMETTCLGWASLGDGVRGLRLDLEADLHRRGAPVLTGQNRFVGLCTVYQDFCCVVFVGQMTTRPSTQLCPEILLQSLANGTWRVCRSNDDNAPVGSTHKVRFDVSLDRSIERGQALQIEGGANLRSVARAGRAPPYDFPVKTTLVKRGTTTVRIDADRATIVESSTPELVGLSTDRFDVASIVSSPTFAVGDTQILMESESVECFGETVERMTELVARRRLDNKTSKEETERLLAENKRLEKENAEMRVVVGLGKKTERVAIRISAATQDDYADEMYESDD